MFVGRLLTDIYSPVKPHAHETLGDAFFATQLTTALFYDPILPLIRRAETDPQVRRRLGGLMGEFFAWAGANPITDVPRFRHECARVLDFLLKRNGLYDAYMGAHSAGHLRPETLLFSAFGAPSMIDLK